MFMYELHGILHLFRRFTMKEIQPSMQTFALIINIRGYYLYSHMFNINKELT